MTTTTTNTPLVLSLLSACLWLSSFGLLAADDSTKGKLLLREDWRETPAALPVTQAHVASRNLLLSLHGPGGGSVKKSHHDEIPNDPWYLWSGECREPWAVSLRSRDSDFDFSRGAVLRWRTKQSGPHILYVILELAEGQWIVSQRGFGETPDWTVFSQPLAALSWRALEIEQVAAGRRIASPDLSNVRSIGWTDLKAGGGSPASTRVDWIEVRQPVRHQHDAQRSE